MSLSSFDMNEKRNKQCQSETSANRIGIKGQPKKGPELLELPEPPSLPRPPR